MKIENRVDWYMVKVTRSGETDYNTRPFDADDAEQLAREFSLLEKLHHRPSVLFRMEQICEKCITRIRYRQVFLMPEPKLVVDKSD